MKSKFVEYVGELDAELFGDWMDYNEPGLPVIFEETGVVVHYDNVFFIMDKMDEAIAFYKSSGMM